MNPSNTDNWSPPPDTQQVLSLLEDLEQRLGQLKEWHSDSARHCDELDQQRAQIVNERGDLDRRRGQLDQREADLSSRQEKFDRQVTEFHELRNQVQTDRQPLLSRVSRPNAREAELGQRQESLDRREAEIGELRHQLQADRDRLDARQSELDDLDDQVRTDRKKVDSRQAELNGQEHRLGEDRRKLDQQRAQLEATRRELDDDRAALGTSQSQSQERKAELDAKQAELEQKAGAAKQNLDQQIAQLKQKRDRLSHHEQQVGERQAALDQREAELEAKGADRRAAIQADTNQLSDMRNRLKDQQQTMESQSAQVTKQFERLNEKEQNLKRRRDQAYQTIEQQRQRLAKERQLLVELRDFMATSEAKMINRWSTASAWTRVIGSFLTALLLTVVCWKVSHETTQKVFRVSTELHVAVPADEQGEGPTVRQWLGRQRDILLSDAVMRETIAQLAQRGIRLHDDPRDMRQTLKTLMHVSASRVGHLVLESTAADPEQSIYLLDALGRGYVAYQMQVYGLTAPNQAPVKITAAAAQDREPLRNYQPLVFATSLGGSLALALVLFVVIRRLMARSARAIAEFDNRVYETLTQAPSTQAQGAAPVGDQRIE